MSLYLLHAASTLIRTLFIVVLGFCMIGCENAIIVVDALEEREANQAMILLVSKGIKANKIENTGDGKIKTWNISVYNEADVNVALQILTDNGIPKNKPINLIDVFKPSGLIPSPQEEQIRYQTAIQNDLASTITQFTGVIDTKVYISVFQNLTQQENFGSTTIKPIKLKASVYVKHNGILDDPNEQMRSKIKRLVSSSVIGLAYEDVTVIGERLSSATQSIIYGSQLDPASEQKYVKVLGMEMSKQSLMALRAVIGTLSALIVILIVVAGWFVWKNSYFISNNWKELFHLSPFSGSPAPQAPSTQPAAAATAPKDDAKKPAPPPPSPVSKPSTPPPS